MSKRLPILFAALGLFLFAGCRINDPNRDGIPTVIITLTPLPTDTLAPLISMTPRFTATLIPSRTPLPTQPPPPTFTPTVDVPTETPTVVPTVVLRGSVNQQAGVVNMRSGPSADFETVRKVNAGTVMTVIGLNDEKSWALVQLNDGAVGWISVDFVNIPESAALPVASGEDATRIAALPPPPTIAPTLPARLPLRNDVLAYCDLPGFEKDAGKTILAGSNINVYWSWFAQSPEQIQDHLDNGTYEVRLGDQLLESYQNYRTSVRRVSATRYEVYWYVPVGKLEAGEYNITYNLTWKIQISDGESTFGPGGQQETNTGTCKFTVK